MGYVIVHNATGKYVSRPGFEHSYTSKLEDAQWFADQKRADDSRCKGSESVVAVELLFTLITQEEYNNALLDWTRKTEKRS